MKKINLLPFVALSFLFLSSDFSRAQTLNARELLQMGHQKKNAGDLDEAIEFYKKALEADPKFEAAKLSLKNATDKKNLVLFSKNFPAQCQVVTKDFDQTLKCAQQYFVIGGKPINFLIIKDLMPWISDTGIQIAAINLLDSQNSNRYFSPHYDVKKHKDFFSVQGATDLEKKDFFQYTLEGKTTSGIFVLQTAEWTLDATGVFHNLLFVRIVEGTGLGEEKNGKLILGHKRLLLENLGEIPLGDRVTTKVTVKGNDVLIETEDPRFPEEKSTRTISIQ